MSGDVFSSINPDENKPVEFKKHCLIKFEKKDYCTYEGVCELERVINRELVCIMCVYREGLYIPQMIKELTSEK